jgi:hypothetical protein
MAKIDRSLSDKPLSKTPVQAFLQNMLLAWPRGVTHSCGAMIYPISYTGVSILLNGQPDAFDRLEAGKHNGRHHCPFRTSALARSVLRRAMPRLTYGGNSFSLAIPVNASANCNGSPVTIRGLADWRISDEFW